MAKVETKVADEQLRLSEESFRLMVESIKDYAIFMLDTHGRIVSWNAGAERIKQYRASEILGRHLSVFYPEEEVVAGKCERELEVAEREGRFEDEGWRVRKDGSRFWANVIISAMRDPSGQLIGFAKVTRDLTERRRLEEEKVRLAQAQEAIRLRDEFLSIASHELKTPLTALQLQLQGVREKVKALDEQAAARLERATRSGARLADVIEALLDVTRIATGRFELNPTTFDLSEAVGEVLERLRGNAAQAGCELRARLEPGVTGTWDRMRLEQVVTNLLANSFKYGAGGPVEISLKSDGAQAELMVCDSGPGIPEKDLARIFERFERAVSMRNYGGMGLGLYVTRQIVDAHGGTVEAHNRPAGGAVFIARVPLMPAHRPKSEQRHKAEDLH
jgi:PAS domain S-box-containing protein